MRLTAVLLTTLVVSLSGSLAVSNSPHGPDTSKMSKEIISMFNDAERIEAIVQFFQEPTDEEWSAFRLIDLELISEMSVLHGGLVSGSPMEIAELSRLPFVKHIEANVPIEHFYLPGDQDDYESKMHETVRWVNASLAWSGPSSLL